MYWALSKQAVQVLCMHAALALEVGPKVYLRSWSGWGHSPAQKKHIISKASEEFCQPDHAGLWRTTAILSEGGQLFALAQSLGHVSFATPPADLAWHVHEPGLQPSACFLCDVCFARPLCDDHMTVWALLTTQSQPCWSTTIAHDVRGKTTITSGVLMACMPCTTAWQLETTCCWGSGTRL